MFKIDNVSMIYDLNSDEKSIALNGFSLELPDKGFVGIIGPSGSGKSTLMYIMSTLKTPTEGKVFYNGQDITVLSEKEKEKLRRNEFGFVFQKHYLVPYMNTIENVCVAGNGNYKELVAKGGKYLNSFGIKDKEFKKKPSKLSGGQCQRVAIARAMINEPKVIFADEPTASLDHENAFKVMNILKEYANEKLIVVVTHDRTILEDADMIVKIWDGKLSEVRKMDKESRVEDEAI